MSPKKICYSYSTELKIGTCVVFIFVTDFCRPNDVTRVNN